MKGNIYNSKQKKLREENYFNKKKNDSNIYQNKKGCYYSSSVNSKNIYSSN